MSREANGAQFATVAGEVLKGNGATCHWSSPVTGEAISFAGAGEHEIAHAVTTAKSAQEDWAALPPLARQSVLMRLADILDTNAQKLGRLDTIDMGKPIAVATQEAHVAAFILRYYAGAIDKTGGFVAPSSREALAVSVRRPHGVVGSIISWNYPAINVMMKVAPSLAAGNAIVLKPSSQAPRSAIEMARLALESDLPKGLFSVLSGSSQVGTLLCSHPDVSMLAFTGSTEVGKRIAGIAAERLIPTIIEAGGKNPILVCDDVEDIEGLASDAIGEAYANSGQLCVARSKIIVPRRLARELTEALVVAARKLQPADALEAETAYGPLSSTQHAQKIATAIERAVLDGARLISDGRSTDPLMQAMSLLQANAPDAEILREEYFGPIMAVAAYDSIEDGIGMANAGGHGLAATLWTTDIRRAKAISTRLVSGHTKVKSQPGLDAGTGMALPVEPHGTSGYGTEFGVAALDSYSRRHAVEYIGYRL